MRIVEKTGGLLLVALIPIAAQAIGSAFNIWYNIHHIDPLLSVLQEKHLQRSIIMVNLVVYPTAVFGWLAIVLQLRSPIRSLAAGNDVDETRLLRARKLTLNLPWIMGIIGAIAWLSVIPSLLILMRQSPGEIKAQVFVHLTVSIVVGGLMAITHAVFAIELATQKFLFPVLFQNAKPYGIPGTLPLTLRGRGTLWVLASVVCPIVCMMLVSYMTTDQGSAVFLGSDPDALLPVDAAVAADSSPNPQSGDFVSAWIVGAIGILFAGATAWMLGRLYTSPIRSLRHAARRVSLGQLDTIVDLRRADEFGPLIDAFNEMTVGLKEKDRLQATFGLHVGKQAAAEIMKADPGLGGAERDITVMFVDIRNFTSGSEGRPPAEVVGVLNEFLSAMVEIVERDDRGMVNKFLGDGFMAIFGVSGTTTSHADDAVTAGIEMIDRLAELNRDFESRNLKALGVGIGIHTGTALVGSIGSERRLEFTAIGDTVNVAARIESLTKRIGVPMLLTAASHERLTFHQELVAHAPEMVKGIHEPITTYSPVVACKQAGE